MVLEAVRPVLSTTNVRDITRVYIASYAPGELCRMTDPFGQISHAIRTGFPDLQAAFHGIYRTGGEALFTALTDMATGAAEGGDVLILGAEKMTHLTPAVAAGILSQREKPHDRAYGATLPALGALVTRAYLRKYRIPETSLHEVAVKNHEHAAKNPIAHFQREISRRDVVESPLIADPLRRLHCAPTSDGAAAVLLSTTEGPAWYRGWGTGTDVPLFQERGDISRFVATAEAAEAARSMADVQLADIDVVEIHDAFASFELINLEEMGFYPRGTAWKALEAGNLRLNSKLAVNTSGPVPGY